ncbi:hypothetical protein GGF46_004647 [Coemansia sp. RSA 552]|nr:hypothetical protein GGF46_004647 [Coemansia sp. RSA 552]
MDIANTPLGPRFVRKPAADAPQRGQSRYEAVGYPKSTRSAGRDRQQGSAQSLSSPPQQSRLRGFEMRVIDTHNGKTVVRAPILSPEASADWSGQKKPVVPKLPPVTAAERRYNAQRALINTTAVLRTAVGTKNGGGQNGPSQKAATLRGGPNGSGQAKGRGRTAVAAPVRQAQTIQATGSDGFHIHMEFDAGQGDAPGPPAAKSLPLGYATMGAGPEQGRASATSVLEQWGFSSRSSPSPQHQGQDSDGDTSDSAGEDARRMVEDIVLGRSPSTDPQHTSALGPDSHAKPAALSAESQQLIDSIFSGRLSIDNNQRLSRCEGGASVATTLTARSKGSDAEEAQLATAMAPRGQQDPAPGARNGRPRLGSTWTQPSQSPQMRPFDPMERDGSKMRKPSFWSIFRAGSQRKDQPDDKRDAAFETASVHSRHRIIRKQQSTSSGFAEGIGFSKRVNQNDAKFGTLQSGHLFVNKALPTVPPTNASSLPPRHPGQIHQPSLQQQQQQQRQLLAGTSADVDIGGSSSQPSAMMGAQEEAPVSPIAFAPDLTEDSGQRPSSQQQHTGDDPRLSSNYYSPMDDFFSVSSADDRQNAGEQDAAEPSNNQRASTGQVLEADTKLGRTLGGSPVIASASLKHDSGAAVAGGDDGGSDDDSDIVPLAQSRAMAPGGVHSDQSERPQVGGSCAELPSGDGSASAGAAAPDAQSGECSDQEAVVAVRDDAAVGAATAQGNGSAADDVNKPRSLPAPIRTTAAQEEQAPRLGEMSPPSGLCFSPDGSGKMFGTGQSQEITPAPSAVSAVPEDTPGPATAGESNDNTQLAQAMGKYLYDLEGYYSSYYSGRVGGPPVSSGEMATTVAAEPTKPSILQGIDIPLLVDHAEWLGKREIFNALALRYYIACYDFGGLRIDESLRRLCAHIYLRGESQVIDRLLVALSQRYIECNPDTRLLTADVAHAVTYSTLLLNTDLHIADIRAMDRMTRSRFVRNTVDTISQFQSATVSSPVGEGGPTQSAPPPQLPELDLSKQSIDSAHEGTASLSAAPSDASDAEIPTAATIPRSSEPSTLRSLVGSMASLNIAAAGTTASRSSRDVVRLMGGRGKRFSLFETSSVPGTPLAGPGSSGSSQGLASGGSPITGGVQGTASPSSSHRAFDRLRRKVSTSGTHGRSRSGTVSMDEPGGVVRASLSASGASANLSDLTGILKEVYSGIKARPLGQPSFARQASVLYEQQARQQRSHGSPEQLGSGKHSLADETPIMYGRPSAAAYADCDSQSGTGRPSSARSVPLHTTRRSRSITSMNKRAQQAEKRGGSSVLHFGGVRTAPSSASIGGFMPSTAYTAYMRSPMENQHIRSGVLVRKHLFERAGKKASHRAWRTCYVSVDRGTVAMYKMDGRLGGHPDGRELTDTSLQLGSVSLRHTMTHMLPPPGYSRTRPHAFALQLPSGGVYLFQTASEVELRDWVAACNYWAARESKAPYMIGGVYNMEYGWDNTGDFALRVEERDAREARGESATAAELAADEQRIVEEREASRGANILEWTPPNNPMQRSDLDEAAQLKALMHHIAYLEEELVSHKKIQGSIDERFAPRTQQFHRAFGNWERKAQYILQELIKYQSYADVLQKALKQMQDDATPPIPEETASGEASSAATTVTTGPSRDAEAEGNGDEMVPHSAPVSRTTAVPISEETPGGSRTSLSRSGPHTPSKALPIRELLPSDKAKQRASIVAGGAVSAPNVFDERRRGSQPQPAGHASAAALTVTPQRPGD